VAPRREIIFGPFRVDGGNKALFKGSELVSLRPKSLAVLRYFLEHPHQLITKEDPLASIWNGSRVVPDSLKVSIGEIRKALGNATGKPRLIETVERKGYRFIASLNVRLPGKVVH
jgi:DNA-binding winged helix-turn-helix (wHTH) protein